MNDTWIKLRAWSGKIWGDLKKNDLKTEIKQDRLEQVGIRVGKGALLGFMLYFLFWAIFFSFQVIGKLSGLIDQPIEQGSDLRGYAYLLIAIVGLPFVFWRAVVAQHQAKTAEQGLFTDRFSKAIELLAADKVVKVDGKESTEPDIVQREGGVIALGRLLVDSPNDAEQIETMLTSYVQTHSQYTSSHPFVKDEDDRPSTRISKRSDVALAFTTLLERRKQRSLKHQLSKLKFIRLDLSYFPLENHHLINLAFENPSLDDTGFSKLECREVIINVNFPKEFFMREVNFENSSISIQDCESIQWFNSKIIRSKIKIITNENFITENSFETCFLNLNTHERFWTQNTFKDCLVPRAIDPMPPGIRVGTIEEWTAKYGRN